MLECIKIDNRNICVKGIGKLFYQEGFPISMAVDMLKKEGIEVSIFHVADECLKNGWSPETICKKFNEDFVDGGDKIDIFTLKKFCNSSYEDQREFIFQYLWGDSSNNFMENKEKRDKFVKLCQN